MLNITLTLKRGQSAADQFQEWWIVNQTDAGPINKRGNKSESGLDLYVFSDQVSPPSLGFLAGYGYVCMYVCMGVCMVLVVIHLVTMVI